MSIAANNPEVTISTMTMPHLMNCPHSEDWCLECVKSLWNDFETANAEAQRLRQERDAMLPVAYAAEEWASGRLTITELAATVADCLNSGERGQVLMSRLIHLESEEKKLLDEIAYLKAEINRSDKR